MNLALANKGKFAIYGVFVLLVSLLLFGYIAILYIGTFFIGPQWERVSGGACSKMEVADYNRVISLDESFIVKVNLENTSPHHCEPPDLYISTVAFDIDKSTIPKRISLSPKEKLSLSFVASPRKYGKQIIIVGLGTYTETLSFNVTNIFGLGPKSIAVLSSLGSFLGSILTLPWWIEWWNKRKNKKILYKK